MRRSSVTTRRPPVSGNSGPGRVMTRPALESEGGTTAS